MEISTVQIPPPPTIELKKEEDNMLLFCSITVESLFATMVFVELLAV